MYITTVVHGPKGAEFVVFNNAVCQRSSANGTMLFGVQRVSPTSNNVLASEARLRDIIFQWIELTIGQMKLFC